MRQEDCRSQAVTWLPLPSRWDIVRGEPSRPAPENTKSPDEKKATRESGYAACFLRWYPSLAYLRLHSIQWRDAAACI